jgi:hypothetical protein
MNHFLNDIYDKYIDRYKDASNTFAQLLPEEQRHVIELMFNASKNIIRDLANEIYTTTIDRTMEVMDLIVAGEQNTDMMAEEFMRKVERINSLQKQNIPYGSTNNS